MPFKRTSCVKALAVITGSTHRFQELLYKNVLHLLLFKTFSSFGTGSLYKHIYVNILPFWCMPDSNKWDKWMTGVLHTYSTKKIMEASTELYNVGGFVKWIPRRLSDVHKQPRYFNPMWHREVLVLFFTFDEVAFQIPLTLLLNCSVSPMLMQWKSKHKSSSKKVYQRKYN